MNEFLSIALHSWWSFLGTVVLLWIGGGLLAMVFGGMLSSLFRTRDTRIERAMSTLIADNEVDQIILRKAPSRRAVHLY